MPKTGYYNLRLTAERRAALSAICARLGTDSTKRGAVGLALDYALNRTIVADKMYREERSTMNTSPDRVTVTAARMIRPYTRPQWLIELHPNAEESDADDLAAINASEWGTLADNLQGWGEYTSVIHVLDTDTYYLARLA